MWMEYKDVFTDQWWELGDIIKPKYIYESITALKELH